MQDNHIIVELGLPALVVEGQRMEGRSHVVTVRYGCQCRKCPGCGKETSLVHQYHRQLKQHKALWGQPVLLEIRRRRFRCKACGRVFMEPDEVCGWRRRSTRALRAELAQGCLTETVKAVARKAEVSESTVRRAFGEWRMAAPESSQPTPKILALDEFWIGPRRGYLTALYAPQEKRIVQLSAGRSQASAERLLNQLRTGEDVEAVVMDMSEPYRQAVKVCCPQALIVADKFHVMAHVLRAMRHVCAQVQAEAERDDARLLRQRSLFAANTASLSATQRQQRDVLLAKYPLLAAGWKLVQAFRHFYEAPDRDQAAARLDRWWQDICQHGPKPFTGLRHMLAYWREEILNYFVYPVTNGFAEGKNNRIKVIMRSGYGYRNVDNLIQRILMSNVTELAAWGANSPHFLT